MEKEEKEEKGPAGTGAFGAELWPGLSVIRRAAAAPASLVGEIRGRCVVGYLLTPLVGRIMGRRGARQLSTFERSILLAFGSAAGSRAPRCCWSGTAAATCPTLILNKLNSSHQELCGELRQQ